MISFVTASPDFHQGFFAFLTIQRVGVLQERLRHFERSVAAAEKDPSKAGRWLNAKIAAEMLWIEDNLSMVLAPFLHGNR